MLGCLYVPKARWLADWRLVRPFVLSSFVRVERTYNNNDNDFISIALFYVKHAQLL